MKYNIKIMLLSIILIAVTIASSLMYFGSTRTDSQSYIQLSYLLQGKDAILLEHWASRPFVPALAALLNQFFDIQTSFGIVNTIFLSLTTLTLYMLFFKLYNNNKLAFISALLYPLSFPVILIGPQVLTDAAGYFFLVLSIYLIEFKLTKLNLYNFVLLGIIIGLALLTRDSSFIIFIYLIISILMNRHYYFKRKFYILYKSFLVFVISLIPFALWKYFSNVKSYPILERILPNLSNIFSFKYFFSAIIRSILAFHILWLPAIYGFIIDKNKKRKIYYYKILITVVPLMILAYLTLSQNFNYDLRHTFALFPMILPLAAYALLSIDTKLKTKSIITISFIILYAIISFMGASLVPETPIRDSLLDIKILQSIINQ